MSSWLNLIHFFVFSVKHIFFHSWRINAFFLHDYFMHYITTVCLCGSISNHSLVMAVLPAVSCIYLATSLRSKMQHFLEMEYHKASFNTVLTLSQTVFKFGQLQKFCAWFASVQLFCIKFDAPFVDVCNVLHDTILLECNFGLIFH